MQELLIFGSICWFVVVGFPASPFDLLKAIKGSLLSLWWSVKSRFGYGQVKWPR